MTLISMLQGRSRLRLTALLIPAMLALSACETNPATGERAFSGLLPASQESSIGQQQHPEILKQYGGVYQDPELTSYVSSVGGLLASASEMPDLDWRFTVLNSPIVNAFALPGGYVYVSRGLVALAENEAELAAVLGHEIGHVTARHAAQRYSRGVVAQAGTVLATVLAGEQIAQLANLGAQGYLASYSRDQERQADELGMRYMARVGFDPYAMPSFLSKMEQQSALLAQINGTEGGQPNLLATHPPTAERVQNATALARQTQVSDPMNGRDVFLSKIDGIVYGDDTDQGVVRGDTFVHPELGFTFSVPSGFTLTNSTSQVVARGPQGSLIVFDEAPNPTSGSVSSYIRNGWASNVQLSGLEDITINGMNAATAATSVRSSNGQQMDARLVAIRWDNSTIYRFQFITPPALTQSLSTELRRATYSFRRLAANERDVTPDRIQIYTVRSGDTIRSIAARMPFSTYAEERLRLLNGLAAGEALQPGEKIKTVTGG